MDRAKDLSVEVRAGIAARLVFLRTEVPVSKVADLSAELGTYQFGDSRLTKRVQNLADVLSQRANISIPAALQSKADIEACYRFFDNESYHWIEGLQCAERTAVACLDTTCVCIGDSESDIYDLFVAAIGNQRANLEVLVRAGQNRNTTEQQDWADQVRKTAKSATKPSTFEVAKRKSAKASQRVAAIVRRVSRNSKSARRRSNCVDRSTGTDVCPQPSRLTWFCARRSTRRTAKIPSHGCSSRRSRSKQIRTCSESSRRTAFGGKLNVALGKKWGLADRVVNLL